MSFKNGDRVRERTLTVGTGAIVLSGATLGGYVTFGSYLADGDTTVYVVVDPFTGAWEGGVGTYVLATNSMSRSAPGVYAGSAGVGVFVALPAGPKEVFNGLPAVPLLLAQDGTTALPGISLASDPSLGLSKAAAGILALCAAGADQMGIASGFALLKAAGLLGWTSGALSAAVDTALGREVAGVLRPDDGAGGVAWIQNPAGSSQVPTDFTTAGTALSDPGWSPVISLKAGRTYRFEVHLIGTDATAAQGVSSDLNGGGATVTALRAQGLIHDTVLQASLQQSTLAGLYNAATFATGQVDIKGTITVNAAGTFIPRVAKNSAGAAVLTIRRGSSLLVFDIT